MASIETAAPRGRRRSPTVRERRRQHRAGHPGQARGHRAGAALPGLRGPPADRGRARRRQDEPGQGAGHVDRLQLRPGPVHPRPAALRRGRAHRVEPGRQHVRVPARPGVRQHRAGRRDQPGLAQDPVGAARGDGRGAGHRRRRHLPADAAVHGHRHAEPDRARGHLPAARVAARPLPHAGLGRLPVARRPSSRSSTRHGDHDPFRRHRPGGRQRPTSRCMAAATRQVHVAPASRRTWSTSPTRPAAAPTWPSACRRGPRWRCSGWPRPGRRPRAAATSCPTTSRPWPSRCSPTACSSRPRRSSRASPRRRPRRGAAGGARPRRHSAPAGAPPC